MLEGLIIEAGVLRVLNIHIRVVTRLCSYFTVLSTQLTPTLQFKSISKSTIHALKVAGRFSPKLVFSMKNILSGEFGGKTKGVEGLVLKDLTFFRRLPSRMRRTLVPRVWLINDGIWRRMSCRKYWKIYLLRYRWQ